MTRLRILHVITGLRLGGAEVSLRNLVKRMDAERFESMVVSVTDGGEVAELLRRDGFSVQSLGIARGVPDPRALTRLKRILSDFRPDVIQSWLYHADLLTTLAAGSSSTRPLIWNVRCSNMDLSQYGPFSRLTLRILARLAGRPAAVVTNSRAGMALHQAVGYRPRRWELIPNGFDTELFRPDPEARKSVRAELSLGENVPLVGLIARFDPMKDHDTFLRAAAAVQAPQAHFVLAGSGIESSNRFLTSRVESAGLKGRCHLLGARTDIARLNAALDVACSSSVSEGFSNSIGEAMACGVPCVVTDVGDSAWVVGESGVVVPPRDAHALARGIDSLLEQGPAGLTRRGELARLRIVRHFGIEAVVARYETLYQEMAGGLEDRTET